MTTEGTHYRTGGKLTNAGCEMLPDGKDIPYIIITKIEYKDEHTINGKKEKGVWVAHFEPNPYTNLPMILNATNRKRIAKSYGTDYIDQLQNIPVRMTRERCRDAQDGGTTWGLRIHKDKPKESDKPQPKGPKAKIILTPEHEKWQGAVEYIKGGKTIDDLRKSFDISDEHAAILVANTNDDLPQ